MNFFRRIRDHISTRVLPKSTDVQSRICGESLDLNSFNVQNDSQLFEILESLQEKQNVRYLHLHSTDVKTLPASIGAFENLTELHLSNNKIEFIPWSILLLKKLTIFDLSNNKVQHLPTVICYLPKLVELNLKNNNLTKLPTELLNLPKILIIKVEGNDSLKSPPLSVCAQGKDKIFKMLQNRLKRTNLWGNWKPYYQENGPNHMRSLVEMCIDCILISDVDFLSASHIPPVMKNYISDVEKMDQHGLLPRLKKCSNCGHYFSKAEFFDNHDC